MTTLRINDDLPLSDPRHPLHRPVVAKATDVKEDNKAKLAAAVKAKSEAKAAKDAAKDAAKVAAKAAKDAAKSEAKATKVAAKAAKDAAKPKKAKPVVEASEDDEDEAHDLPRSIVPARFKQAYADHKNTCGDRMALALKSATTVKNEDGRDSLDVEALAEIAKANGIDLKPYMGLNNGQKRMNVGNKMRGLIKHGTTVTIGKQRFAMAGLTKDEQVAA